MIFLLELNFFGLQADNEEEVNKAKTNLYEEIYWLRKQNLLSYEEIYHMHTSQRKWWLRREIKFLEKQDENRKKNKLIKAS